MAKKSLESKMVDLANELFDAQYKIYDTNVDADSLLPEDVELLLKEMDITKRHLEQLAFLLRKYNKHKN